MNPRVLAIIPAREGSKRVPQKNFRHFAGSTLVDIAIEHCLGSRMISDITLSSDSETVLSIGKKYPRVKNISRPAVYSTDESPAIDYVRHTLGLLELETSRYDILVIVQPSSPLRSSQDIDATIRLLLDHPEADSAVSVVKVSHMIHPVKLKTMRNLELLPFLEDEKGRFASGDLPEVFVRNCAVYVTWRKDLENRTDVIGKKSMGYLMPPETSVDINDMIDFEFAEFLFRRKNR